jgi:hypothetical protein
VSYDFVADSRKVAKMVRQPHVLESWDWFDAGWQSTTWNVGTNGDIDTFVPGSQYHNIHVEVAMQQPGSDFHGSPQVTWNQPLATGTSDVHLGFLVYRDKVSPAEPKGTKWMLDHLGLTAKGLENSGKTLTGKSWRSGLK